MLAHKDHYLSCGLMSGTSMDGVDAALVRLSSEADLPTVELLEFTTVAYPAQLKGALGDLSNGQNTTAEDVATASTAVAVAFSGAFFDVCRAAGVEPATVDFIGSHGQTVAHVPPSESTTITGTLQLGPAGMVAALTGVTTVGDFRVGDIALGGQGAPLAPCADYLLRRSRSAGRVILNIGGIANLTWLPRGAARSDVLAFDTGPGNMVIDELYRALFPGRGDYDQDGAAAAAGTVSEEMLGDLLQHPFFAIAPPKSAGHREFGAPYAWEFANRAKERGLTREDTMATATALTAASIANAIEQHLPAGDVEELFVTGGGAHNPVIWHDLESRLAGVNVKLIDELGVPADAKEAVDFALLAREALAGRPNIIPAVTGGARELVAGCIARGNPR